MLLDSWVELFEQRESQTHCIVEGRIPVQALLDSSEYCEAVFTTNLAQLNLGAPPHDAVPYQTITKQQASTLLGFQFHRGHIAVAQKPTLSFQEWWQNSAGICSGGVRDPQLIVIIPELADPGNLGTIIRNSRALGAEAILCGTSGTSPYNAKAIRAAAGATFQIPIFVSTELQQDIEWLAQRSQIIAAALSPDACAPEEISLTPPVSLMLGREDTGLDSCWLDYADALTKIPMQHGFDSLNVASSSAILLYEMHKALSNIPLSNPV